MEKLKILITNLKGFQQNKKMYAKEALRIFEPEILQLNYEDQLYRKGITANGDAITPEYAPRTIAIKRSKGQVTTHVTLRDTGDFHRSFYLKVGASSAKIDAGDRKTQELTRKYANILGLTPENLIFVNERYVRPELIKRLKLLL